MSTYPLASRLSSLQPSATVAITQRARELRAQGIDVLPFSMGEPDFGTPAHICAAASEAITQGATRYTSVGGIPELRASICEASKRRRQVEYDPSQVVVSTGAKHTLFNLSQVLYEPGDEVLIPAPHWVSYPDQVRLAGAEPVVMPTTAEDGFCLRPDQLQQALTERTKALILCSPSNPTGAAYDEGRLRALAEVLRSHRCWIIVDEIYGELVYGDFKQKSIAEVAPELRERIIVVDGVSKTYAMTGWRIGWMLGPVDIARACEKLQGQMTSNPTAVAQHAAIAALSGTQEPVNEMRAAFEARRSLVVEGLNGLDGVACRAPEGAFYAFPSVQGLLGKKSSNGVISDDVALAEFLLEEARCAVVPGTAFGAPGFLRMSYAAHEDTLREGLRRIETALSSLQ